MPTLVEQLGLEYVDQFYKNSHFRVGDKLYKYVSHHSRATLHVQTLDLTRPNAVWTPEIVANDIIVDMDTFAWPKLGYRNMRAENGMSLPYFVSTQRSAMRGFRDDFIFFSPPSTVLMLPSYENPRNYLGNHQYMREIYTPSFIAFDEGMAKLKDGAIPGFAINEDLCITMCIDDAEREFDVYHRERLIGSVDSNNVVRIPHAIAKKTSSVKLFGGNLE